MFLVIVITYLLIFNVPISDVIFPGSMGLMFFTTKEKQDWFSVAQIKFMPQKRNVKREVHFISKNQERKYDYDRASIRKIRRCVSILQN